LHVAWRNFVIRLTWKVKCLKSLIFCFLLFSSSSRRRFSSSSP
jgi:hypothetical protein